MFGICGNCGKETEELIGAWWDDGAPWCKECAGPAIEAARAKKD